ncbi:CoA transferase [Arsenicicoccus dermatophilus]|uniref:CoA transferase n=1 Tax=Arsenicicoccus dermatophilus TaxID=1076331 RepID=UPI00391734A0
MSPEPPLAGVRVVSLAVNVPGPVAAARLLRLGADVVKVEPPRGDPLLGYAPRWYAELRAGQQVQALDLRSAPGAADLAALLDDADLLITAHRTSSLERLGLGWATLQARWPRLCQVAIVGHPAPEDDLAGHDLTYQAVAGTLTPPAMPAVLAADLAGAERAVSEALAALLLRDRTGGGTRREVALAACAGELGAPARHGLTAPGSLLGGGLPGYAVYAAADGHVALAALEPHFWERARELFGADDHEGLAQVLATRPAGEWERLCAERDIPLAQVRRNAQPDPGRSGPAV